MKENTSNVYLSNGFNIIHEAKNCNGLFSAEIWVYAGSQHESELCGSGVSHLIEHMLFKGTEGYEKCSLLSTIESFGGILNAYTKSSYTSYKLTGPVSKWRDLIGLFLDFIFKPKFDQESFVSEREVIRREMALLDESSNDKSYHYLLDVLYKKHNCRIPAIGIRELFDKLSYEDMLSYYKRKYIPNNMFLSIAGEISLDELAKLVENSLRDFPARRLEATPQCPLSLPSSQLLYERTHNHSSAYLIYAWRIPFSADNKLILEFLRVILGQGHSSWLYARMKEDLNIVKHITTMIFNIIDSELVFVIWVNLTPSNSNKVIDKLHDYIKALSSQAFDHVLKSTKAKLRCEYLKSRRSASDIAHHNAVWWFESGRMYTADDYEKVNSQYLCDFINQHITLSKCTKLLVNPKSYQESSLRNLEESQAIHYTEKRLTNGIRLVIVPKDSDELAHIAILFDTGIHTEKKGTQGINTMLARMIIKEGGQKLKKLENLGCQLINTIGQNCLQFSVTTLTENVETTLTILADLLLNTSFSESTFECIKSDMIAALESEETISYAKGVKTLREQSYGDSFLGHHLGGTYNSIQSLTLADCVTHYSKNYVTRKMVLSMSGDFDSVKLLENIDHLFSSIPLGEEVVHKTPQLFKSSERTIYSLSKSAELIVGIPVSPQSLRDLCAQFFLYEWCNSRQALLINEIRQKRGLAYHVLTRESMYRDSGFIYFLISVAPSKLEETRYVLDATLEKISREGIPRDEAELIRVTLLTKRLSYAQYGDKRSVGAGINVIQGKSAQTDEIMINLIQTITYEEVQDYITRVFTLDTPRSYVMVLPSEGK